MLGSTVESCSSVVVLWRCLFQFIVKVVDLLFFTETSPHSVKLCKVVDYPVMAQRTFLWSRAADHRDFQVAVYCYGGRRGCAGPAVRVHAVWRQSRSHSCSPFFWTLSFARSLCATTDAHGRCPRAVHRRFSRPCDHAATFAQWKCSRFSYRR